MDMTVHLAICREYTVSVLLTFTDMPLEPGKEQTNLDNMTEDKVIYLRTNDKVIFITTKDKLIFIS